MVLRAGNMGFGLPGTDNRRSMAVDVAAVKGGGGGALGGEGGLTQVLAVLEDFRTKMIKIVLIKF